MWILPVPCPFTLYVLSGGAWHHRPLENSRFPLRPGPEGHSGKRGRTRATGYDVVRAKFLSLVISGSFSGLAGALFTVYLGYGSLMTLFWMTSGSILMMTLLGGMHTFIGPVVGVGVFLYLQNTISVYTDRWQLFVGALFVALVLFFPDGLVGTIKMKYRERKSRA